VIYISWQATVVTYGCGSSRKTTCQRPSPLLAWHLRTDDCLSSGPVAIAAQRTLRFGRNTARCACPAHLYDTFGIMFLRCRHRQILWPVSGHPKFANRLCRHSDVGVRLNRHTVRQIAESDLERGSTFRSIPHGLLPPEFLFGWNNVRYFCGRGDYPASGLCAEWRFAAALVAVVLPVAVAVEEAVA
jgi:hypothetical protein